MADPGKYNHNQELYSRLVNELEAAHPPITLTSEYAYFVEKDLLRLLIRLARYKFIARLLKPTDTVLEVGSGSGLGALFLSQHCKEVVGIEVKKSEVEEAQSINRRKNVSFIHGDLHDLSVTKKYDAIVALDVIEHIPETDASNFFKVINKHLGVSGMCMIGTPSAHSYPHQSALSKASHEKCYDQHELVSLMDTWYGRTLPFSMNDEIVHTGNPKMAWYYFVLGLCPCEGA